MKEVLRDWMLEGWFEQGLLLNSGVEPKPELGAPLTAPERVLGGCCLIS